MAVGRSKDSLQSGFHSGGRSRAGWWWLLVVMVMVMFLLRGGRRAAATILAEQESDVVLIQFVVHRAGGDQSHQCSQDKEQDGESFHFELKGLECCE